MVNQQRMNGTARTHRKRLEVWVNRDFKHLTLALPYTPHQHVTVVGHRPDA